MHILPDLDALEKRFSIQDGLVVVSTKVFKTMNINFINKKFLKSTIHKI